MTSPYSKNFCLWEIAASAGIDFLDKSSESNRFDVGGYKYIMVTICKVFDDSYA